MISISLVILLLAAPFLMPTWRWFLLLCAAYGVMWVGVWYGVKLYDAADVPDFLVAVGNLWLDFMLPILPYVLVARAVVLAAKSWGIGGWKLIGLNFIAICALPAFSVGSVWFRQWEQRPAPVSCTQKQIPIDLDGLKGTLPWSEAINLYLGAKIRRDARYLFSPGSRRKICRQTDNGKSPLPIEAITIDFHGRDRVRCKKEGIQPWEQSACAASRDESKDFFFLRMVIFQPDGIKLGDFSIRDFQMDGSLVLRSDEQLFSANHPAFGSVEFACRPQGNDAASSYCMSRFPISEAVDVRLEMTSSIAEIDKNFEKALSISKAICNGIFNDQAC